MGIYIKPTGHLVYQNWNSDKPENIRLSGLRSLIHRVFTLPITSTAIDDEILRLKGIAKGCGIPHKIWIREIHGGLRKTKVRSAITTLDVIKKRPSGIPVRLPWEGGRWRVVGTHLKKQGMYPVWVGGRDVQQLMPKYKGPSPKAIPPRAKLIPKPLMTGGVYQLNCNQCEARYIGQTGSFFSRFEQHIGDIRNQRDSGALVPHLCRNHQFRGFDTEPTAEPFVMNPIYFCQEPNVRNLIESALIFREGADLLNREAGPAISPLVRVVAGAIPTEVGGATSRDPTCGLSAAPTASRNRIAPKHLTVAPAMSA
jgi:hypothetical protein